MAGTNAQRPIVDPPNHHAAMDKRRDTTATVEYPLSLPCLLRMIAAATPTMLLMAMKVANTMHMMDP